MIRNTRLYITLNAIAALLCAGLAVEWAYRWRSESYSVFPPWINMAINAALALGFFYQIYHRVRYGAPESLYGLSDRQLWTIRGVAIGLLLIFGALVLWASHHR